MPDLTLICETCRFPITGDTGAIYVPFADLQQTDHDICWRTSHYAHPGMDEDSYGIAARRIATWQQLAWWTAHLMEKNWFRLSDWDTLLLEVAGETEPRRIRVAVREAA